MDVDIDVERWKLKLEHADQKTPLRHEGVDGFVDDLIQLAAFDQTPVDKIGHVVAIFARHTRREKPRFDALLLVEALVFDIDDLAAFALAVDIVQQILDAVELVRGEDDLAAAQIGEIHCRKSQRKFTDEVVDQRTLVAVRANEFFSCRHIVVEIPHLNAGTLAWRRHRKGGVAVGVRGEHMRRFCFRLTAGDAQTADHCDRRQRLAAKAEGVQAIDVVEIADLARRVTLYSQRQVVLVESVAIVDHLDQIHAATVDLNGDVRGVRIQRIFYQLLHRRQRPFDDLAGSDLVSDTRIQYVNDPHE